MVQTVGEIMTRVVVQLPAETNLVDAAQAMRDRHIGDVLVTDRGTLAGLATDRDIVIRAVAEARDPVSTRLAEIVSGDVIRVETSASVVEAVQLMREHAVRRLVVTDFGGSVAGVVSIGDLAVAMDPSSALSEISKAPPTD